jgi:cellulose synthase/poly-beta-1,6-N-acetylglucosamine synthase-like glycosyltransferase
LYKSVESDADSVFIVFGELFAFRRELIERIDENAAADDLEIALTIRKEGYRIRYSPDVEVREKVPSRQKEVRIQKTRRIFGILQAMVNNFHFFLNPKYGIYGLLIFPTHFFQMTFGPFLIFIFLALLIGKLSILLVNLPLLGTFLAVAFFVFLILYFSVGFVKKVVSLGYNFLATEAFMIIALVNLVRGKKYGVWEKITSTRDEA